MVQAVKPPNQRLWFIDSIRILACFLVVLMHSPLPSDNASGIFLTAVSYLTAPSIGLFFMMSGALILPVKEAYGSFVKRRVSKILFPLILWNVIYLGFRLYCPESPVVLMQTLFSIPFSPQGLGVLWFLYTLVGLYLLAPIISPWLKTTDVSSIKWFLILWTVTLCYPFLSFFIRPDQSVYGILYYFTGYVGYFVLGYYLKNYPTQLPMKWIICIAVIGPLLLLTLKTSGVEYDFYALFWYLSIFIAALCVIVWKSGSWLIERFTLIKKMAKSRFVLKISNLTFGVYLVHILLMRWWIWKWQWIEALGCYPLQSILIAVLTFVISLALCFVISVFPIGKWLIGYYKRVF